jgi:ABC-type sugar transport system ATPase subunit
MHVDRVRTRRYPGAEVSLTVNRGEVLGVAGLIGAGRSELAETICGVATRMAGRVLLDGQPLAIDSPRDAIRAGICLVPEDRRGHGLIAGMSVRENITLPALGSYARLVVVKRSAEAKAARSRRADGSSVDRSDGRDAERRQPAEGRSANGSHSGRAS